MSAYEQYCLFNRIYDDFIVTLMNYFPQVRRLQFYRDMFHQFVRSDYRIPGRLFLSSVGPHSIHIFNKNDEYFLNGVEVTKSHERAIIEKTIVHEWLRMSEEQKQTVWFYLQRMLLILADIEEDDANDVNETVEIQASRVLGESFQNDGAVVFK